MGFSKMTPRELKEKHGLDIRFVRCANAGCAMFAPPPRRPDLRGGQCYEAWLFTDEHMLIGITSRDATFEPVAGGWTQKEASERLVKLIRGKKVMSIGRYGRPAKVFTVPKTLTA